MRVGIALPHYDGSLGGAPVTWDGVRRIAEVAERAGFDSAWVSDHLSFDWGKYGGPADPQGVLECWTTMTALAAVVRLRIGSMALCNDLRNPALLAKMAASLDVVSSGRLELGMGAGWYEPEYTAAGIEFASPAVRIRRLGEAAEVVGRLLAGEEVTFRGRHYALRGARCRPRPVQKPRPRVWLGGKGDLLLATAARVADGWNFSWLGAIDTYRERCAAVEAACGRAGRDPSTLRRSVGAYVLAGTDEKDARRRFERLAQRTPRGVLRGGRAATGVSWEEFRRERVAGAAGEVTERLAELGDLGVEEVIVGFGTLPFQVSDEEDIEVFGAEVAPALHEMGGPE